MSGAPDSKRAQPKLYHGVRASLRLIAQSALTCAMPRSYLFGITHRCRAMLPGWSVSSQSCDPLWRAAGCCGRSSGPSPDVYRLRTRDAMPRTDAVYVLRARLTVEGHERGSADVAADDDDVAARGAREHQSRLLAARNHTPPREILRGNR
eukprot:1286424-Rhodomonas_salina.1